MTLAPRDPGIITGYHAHIYYPDADAKARAAAVRDAITETFDAVEGMDNPADRVRLGRWRDMPVGPHPIPMYQVAFQADRFPEIVPWLMLNRQGLTVLVHPETGDDIEDHFINPLWLGEKLDLDMEKLKRAIKAGGA